MLRFLTLKNKAKLNEKTIYFIKVSCYLPLLLKSEPSKGVLRLIDTLLRKVASRWRIRNEFSNVTSEDIVFFFSIH